MVGVYGPLVVGVYGPLVLGVYGPLVVGVGGPLVVGGFGPLLVLMVGRCGLTKKDGLSSALLCPLRARNKSRRKTNKDITTNRDVFPMSLNTNMRPPHATRRAPHKNTKKTRFAPLILITSESISG